MRSAPRLVLALAALSLLAACPPKTDAPPATVDAGDADAPPTAAEKELQALAEQVRRTCEAEFQRVVTEQLTPGAPTPCELGEKARLVVKLHTVRPSVAELPAGGATLCRELQEELDLAVKQAGPGNTHRSEAGTRVTLEGYRRLVLVGVVADRQVTPSVKLDASGKPTSVMPGSLSGTGYLYSVRTGQLLCAARGAADNSKDAKALQAQQLPDEAAANQDLVDDLEANFAQSLLGASRLSLAKPAK